MTVPNAGIRWRLSSSSLRTFTFKTNNDTDIDTDIKVHLRVRYLCTGCPQIQISKCRNFRQISADFCRHLLSTLKIHSAYSKCSSSSSSLPSRLLDTGDPLLYPYRCSRAEALLYSQTEQVDSSTLRFKVLLQKPLYLVRTQLILVAHSMV